MATEPEHAAAIIRSMARAVRIPVTVKMRAGWDEGSLNAGRLARLVEDAGAAAVTVHGRTAKQAYSGQADWSLIGRVAESLSIPVFGSGDCVEPEQVVDRLAQHGVAGVLVGRGVLRNPWILTQTADLLAGRPKGLVTGADRGRFLLDYVDLLLNEGEGEHAGFRHTAGATSGPPPGRAADAGRRARWVVNKLRALNAWYSRGITDGSRLRVSINAAESVDHLRDLIRQFFLPDEAAA